MSRKTRNGSTLTLLFEMASDIFSTVPPWISLPIAILAWAVISYGINSRLDPRINVGSYIGHFFGGPVGLTILAGGFVGWRAQLKRKQFLGAHIDLQWVMKLSWREFEEQVAAVYRRKGYKAELLGGNGADGGVDVRLNKDGKVTLVQCKHWKSWKIGVKVIRELYGVMSAEGAHAGILITSGRFTDEVNQFAVGKPIALIEQERFLDLVREFQRDLRQDAGVPVSVSSVSTPKPTTPPVCPLCSSPMTLRTARKSSHTGSSFWGCSRFPYHMF